MVDSEVVHGSLVAGVADLEDARVVVDAAAVVLKVVGAEVCEEAAGVDCGGFTPVLGTG